MKKIIAVLLAAIIFASTFTAVYAAEDSAEGYAELYAAEGDGEMAAFGETDGADPGQPVGSADPGHAARIDNEYPGSLGKYIGYSLLTTVTLGWYAMYKENKAVTDINTIIPGAELQTGWKVYLLTYITCGIWNFFWDMKIKNCLNEELARRGIDYRIELWWLWTDYKIYKATNLLIDDYNK